MAEKGQAWAIDVGVQCADPRKIENTASTLIMNIMNIINIMNIMNIMKG